ncbi:MAG TPA: hypothetical protein VNY30_18470 [Bryobacteraceae bacterium]|nr:hypothetical protein [Bryobacteraceae bacterium]
MSLYFLCVTVAYYILKPVWSEAGTDRCVHDEDFTQVARGCVCDAVV